MKLFVLLTILMFTSSSVIATTDYSIVEENCSVAKEPVQIEFCTAFIKIHENREKCSDSELKCNLTETMSLMTLKEYISLKIDLLANNELEPDKIQEICISEKTATYNICVTDLLIKESQQKCTKSKSECTHDKLVAYAALNKYADMQIAWLKEHLKKLKNE